MAGAPVVGPRRIGVSALSLLGTRIVCTVMGTAVFALLGRTLGPADLGRFTTGLVLLQIGASLVDYPLNAIQLREGSALPTAERAIARWVAVRKLVVGTVLALGLVGLAGLLAASPTAWLAMSLVVLTLPLGWFQVGLISLQQKGRLGVLSLLLLLQSGVWLGVVITLAAAHVGLVGFGLGYLGATAVFSIGVRLADIRGRKGTGRGTDWRGDTAIITEAVQLTLVSIMSVGYYKLDTVLVFRINGAVAGGVYAIAYRFIDQGQIVPTTLANVFAPTVAEEFSRAGRAGPVFERYLRLTLLTTVPCTVLGILLSRPVVRLLFGPAYDQAVMVLQLLLPAFVPISLGYVVTSAMVAGRQTRRQLVPAGLALVLTVGANLVLLPHFGPKAAAVITVVTEATYVAFLYLRIRRPCQLQLPSRWLAKLAALTVLPLAVGLGASRAFGGGANTTAAVFAVGYTIGAIVGRLTDRRELVHLREP